MYARVISFVVKPYQVRSFCDAIEDITREIASRQEGFIEHLILISEEEKRLVTVISLWETKTEADHYHADVFPSISTRLMPMVDSGPNISYCTANSALKLNLIADLHSRY
jgi:quinol monooxygenase YgiN